MIRGRAVAAPIDLPDHDGEAPPRFRVAMVAACPFPCPRGTPVRILRMAEALARRGHEVHVVTYHLGSDPPDAPFRIHRIRDVRRYRKISPGPTLRKLGQVDPLLAARVVDVVRDHALDLIHAHHYEGLLAGLWARRRTGRPIVYDAHTLLEPELPSYDLPLPAAVARRIGRWLDRTLPARADEVIAVTETIKRELVRAGGVAADRVTVVANGVEHERFKNAVESSRVEAGSRLIFAGNTAPYQGIDHLLKSFRHVRERREDVRLTVATGDSFEAYEGLARALRVREFVDVAQSTFEQLPEQLGQADVALNPRLSCTGVPQKLLNYMAAARPIVSFEGSRWILEHGRTGWLVEDGNDRSFADGVLRLLGDPSLAASLAMTARDVVLERYDWDRMATRVERVYGRVASRLAGRMSARG
jgi:glycosyltransferase involved in cell wall biosynthesis